MATEPLEKVGVFTVPETWVNVHFNLDTPYRRIVGLAQSESVPVRTWARVDAEREEPAYNPDDAALETMELPGPAAQRLGSFFSRYFVEAPNIQQRHLTPFGVVKGNHNCHRFGYWMSGNPVAAEVKIPAAPDNTVRGGIEVTGNLAHGKHGVYGVRYDRDYARVAVHSVIGLGEERDECLHVTATGGLLGIDTYSRLRELYGSQDPGYLGLFTL